MSGFPRLPKSGSPSLTDGVWPGPGRSESGIPESSLRFLPTLRQLVTSNVSRGRPGHFDVLICCAVARSSPLAPIFFARYTSFHHSPGVTTLHAVVCARNIGDRRRRLPGLSQGVLNLLGHWPLASRLLCQATCHQPAPAPQLDCADQHKPAQGVH